MAGTFQPLDDKFAIVDGQGRPTLYFIKWAQQRQIDISDGLNLQDLIDYLTAHALREGSGIQFTPDGEIPNMPMIAADVQEILDQVTATRGAILYRGLLGWSALLPGTAGLFLQTAGAGADPLWAAGGAGGGGGVEVPMTPPTITGFTQLNFAAGTTFTNTAKGVLIRDTTGTGNIRGVCKTPDPTNFTLIVRLHRLAPNSGTGYQACIFARNSTSGRIMIHGEFGGIQHLLQSWTSFAAVSGNAVAATNLEIASFPWRKLVRIGNELDWYASADGEDWGLILTGTTTTGWAPSNFLTATGGNIDQVGFGIMATGATALNPMGTTCCSFQLTTP